MHLNFTNIVTNPSLSHFSERNGLAFNYTQGLFLSSLKIDEAKFRGSTARVLPIKICNKTKYKLQIVVFMYFLYSQTNLHNLIIKIGSLTIVSKFLIGFSILEPN